MLNESAVEHILSTFSVSTGVKSGRYRVEVGIEEVA